MNVAVNCAREEVRMAEGKTPSDCLAILLVGRTGQGKSSTGNKLLKAGGESVLRHYDIQEFKEGGGKESCTREIDCTFRPQAGEAKAVQVIDTPGFADSKAVKDLGVYKANLAMFRDLIRKRINEQSRIDRVLYFLPGRGPPERADGVLQEEIKVMHHFFGNAIFDCMVLVATLHKRKQLCEFDDDDMEDTRETFERALELASLEGGPPKCPPVMFVGFKDAGIDIQNKIESAPVESDEGILLNKFVKGTCSRCASKSLCREEDSDPKIPKGVVVEVKGEEEKLVPYQFSQCHPLFIPKYSYWVRAAGGAVHVATLGIPMLIKKLRTGEIPWPTFTSNDEMCANCNQSPGSDGCMKVGTKYKTTLPTDSVNIVIDHTNRFED